jgi:hypothetical protein
MKDTPYQAVLFDPAPQNEVRPFVIAARRMANRYTYLALASHTVSEDEALGCGCNSYLSKPIDEKPLLNVIESSNRFTNFVQLFGDESEDFPSRNGIIAKSAFNQIFLSCLDRADRYAENSYLIFVSIRNAREILNNDGPEAIKSTAVALRKYLTKIRRLSDICGQIKLQEYAMLLLRPVSEEEPFLAAKRFASSLAEYHDLMSTAPTKPILNVTLLNIPKCDILAQHKIDGTG